MRVRVRQLALLLAMLMLSSVGILGVSSKAYAAGPCVVNGFTNHAKLRMSERDIGEGEVRESVAVHCDTGIDQGDGTWRYESTSGFLPTVVLNNDGFVVTVWRPGGNGGGGGGGWSVSAQSDH